MGQKVQVEVRYSFLFGCLTISRIRMRLFAFGVLLIAVAWWYSRIERSVSLEKSTVVGWERHASVPSERFRRVAVGLNANVDLIVSGTDLLRALGASEGRQADYDEISSIEQLQQMFEHRMARCWAAERVDHKTIIQRRR
eukprot:m.95439 g.95439  ORF g.95439 m.95439 type:complete len:140 (+) comp36851_c0_seq1:97-516(+)